MTKLKLVLLTIVISLGGCSLPATIQKSSESKSAFEDAFYKGDIRIVGEDLSNNEQYRIFEQGASGFVSLDALKVGAEQEANDFCKGKNKEMKTIKVQTSRRNIFLPGNFPKIEITFVCVDKPEYEEDKYLRLINLKKLLDSGALTQLEFDREKGKILSDK